MPIFVLGVLVQIFLGLYFGNWLRDRERCPTRCKAMFSVSYQADYPWASLVIPAFVLGALSLGFIARLTRTSLIESLRSDYVRTARAKGLKPSRVVGVHALRNSLIPVVTFIGIDIGALMGGALVTEGIFNIPGIGGLTFHVDPQRRDPGHPGRGDPADAGVPGRVAARRPALRRPRPKDPL